MKNLTQQRLIGGLMYLGRTRLDTVYATNYLGQFNKSFMIQHWKMSKRALCCWLQVMQESLTTCTSCDKPERVPQCRLERGWKWKIENHLHFCHVHNSGKLEAGQMVNCGTSNMWNGICHLNWGREARQVVEELFEGVELQKLTALVQWPVCHEDYSKPSTTPKLQVHQSQVSARKNPSAEWRVSDWIRADTKHGRQWTNKICAKRQEHILHQKGWLGHIAQS